MPVQARVEEPSDADATAVGVVHLRAWHETYDAAPGIDRAWVDEHIGFMASPAADDFRRRLFSAQRTDPARTFYRVARAGGAAVGFVHASLPTSTPAEPSEHDDDEEVRLEGLYLLRSQHGTGLADRLLAAVLTWADGRAISLEASPLSVRAVPFYRRHGFVPTGETGVFRDRVPTLAMRRRADR